MGWNCVRQIARCHEVWVLTRANNRQPIEAALAKEPLLNAHFIYFDLPGWLCFWKKGERGVYLYYFLWQLAVYWVAKRLHRQVSFDLVHHVTLVNYWMPTFLTLLSVPFVWGPVGGGESAPRAFWRSLSLRGKIYELLRDLARSLSRMDPFVLLAARRAVLGLATTSQTAEQLRALGCPKVVLHPAVGLPGDEIDRLRSLPLRQSNPFRLLSIGNLWHVKGFELGLKAFAQFHSQFPESEYWIIGTGPDRPRLEKLAQKLGVIEKVTFWGNVPRSQVVEKLGECDALAHPSLHDSGGWVCLEAMAAARPVICLDLGGPGVQVTEGTGIKVPAISPEQVVHDLAAALSRLASDPGLRCRLGQAARQRAEEEFAWDRKGEFLMGIYARISPRRAELRLPSFRTLE